MRGISGGNMHPARVATVTAATFIVAFAPVLCELAQTNANSLTGDCSGANKGTQEVKVSKPDTTVQLKCDDADDKEVIPPFDETPFKVCTDPTCGSPQQLSELIKGATGQKDTKVTATIKIKDLPSAEKTFYVQCGKSDPCYILVKVASGTPGGVTPGSPLSCAKTGASITINIPEKGSTAQFTCGGLTLYPLAAERVFAEDCKKEENLKDIVRSVNANVYTLTADKKPPKKKWCYLCASSKVTSLDPGKASDYCLVHVESSSRTQSSSGIALAAMLPCVLAMLHIT